MTDRDKLIRRFSDEVADAVHVHSPWPNEGRWTMDQELHLDLRVILGRLLDADRDERIVGLEILLSLSDKEAGSMEVGYLASLQERDQRIAELEAEVERLREALEKIMSVLSRDDSNYVDDCDEAFGIAHQALNEQTMTTQQAIYRPLQPITHVTGNICVDDLYPQVNRDAARQESTVRAIERGAVQRASDSKSRMGDRLGDSICI